MGLTDVSLTSVSQKELRVVKSAASVMYAYPYDSAAMSAITHWTARIKAMQIVHRGKRI